METLRGMKEERETLGVELYGIQQQLARQQMLVEREQDGHTTLHQLRTQREETLAQVREMYHSMQEQVDTDRKQSECDVTGGSVITYIGGKVFTSSKVNQGHTRPFSVGMMKCVYSISVTLRNFS